VGLSVGCSLRCRHLPHVNDVEAEVLEAVSVSGAVLIGFSEFGEMAK
jgi:hypothetical protein